MNYTKKQVKEMLQGNSALAILNGESTTGRVKAEKEQTRLTSEEYSLYNYYEARLKQDFILFWLPRPQVHYAAKVVIPDVLVCHIPTQLMAGRKPIVHINLVWAVGSSTEVNQGQAPWLSSDSVFVNSVLSSGSPVPHDITHHPAVVEQMTAPERNFAVQIEQDKDNVLWVHEPKIRMPGQTYTPDFMTVGLYGVRMYEVKGGYSLGSESRSSVKLRWAASVFPWFDWYFARLKDGQWNIREIKNNLPSEPVLEAARKVCK